MIGVALEGPQGPEGRDGSGGAQPPALEDGPFRGRPGGDSQKRLKAGLGPAVGLPPPRKAGGRSEGNAAFPLTASP